LYRSLITWLTLHVVRAGRALLYSSAYISLVAMTEVAVATVLLSLPLTLAPVVVGLVTFAVYTGDRLADADTDEVSNPRQAAFVRRHGDVLYLLTAAAYALAVTLSILGGPVALAITLLPGVFWVLYASEWIPDVGLHVDRLKQVLVVNSGVVALAWAVTLTFLPLAFADAPVTPTVGVVFAYFFLRSFVDTELPNVRDVDADRATDVATLPVAVGVRRTRHVLYGVDVGTLGLVACATAAGVVHPALSVALAVGLLYSIGITSFLGRFEDEALLAKLPECEYVFVGVALVPYVVGG
jgi:4-hydroxybenzoate polyprenyltransferase